MAGTEFLSNEQPEKAKLNQKTTFVDTGTNIAALATTYPGQMAYATTTSGGFTADTLYVRNAANSAWVTATTATTGITAGTATTFTGPSDDTNHDAVAGTRYYAFYTLPTTEPFYVITNIKWKNGTAVAGNITCGVDRVDANPPTLAATPLLALGMEVAQAGTHPTTQTNSNISSSIIPGGTIIGVWVQASSASADFRKVTGSSQNQRKAASYPTTGQVYATENTAWTATTDKYYVTVTYTGYY